MKKTCLLTLTLTLTLIPVLAQFQKPQWEMPFYFEDAEGAKDTVWLGYDSDASEKGDEFDRDFETWIGIDTSKFNVVINYPEPSPYSNTFSLDSGRKIGIESSFHIGYILSFIKGKLPLKISWPDSLLNSDSLPFPDLSPRHRAKAWIPNILGIAYPDPLVPCSFSGYFTIVSDPAYVSGNEECLVVDSLVLTSPDNDYYTAEKGIERIGLVIIPQNRPTGVGIEEKDRDLIRCFPNPFRDRLSVSNSTHSKPELVLYDAFGREVMREPMEGEQKVLQLDQLSVGIYFLHVQHNRTSFMHRLVKIP